MKRLAVVGGGISGLAAAWIAAEGSAPGEIEVQVLEKERQVGGKARSVAEGGWLVEEGPAGFLAPDPALDRLAAAAGLEAQRVAADAAAARRFVVRGGRMREVSAHPVRFARAGILGPLGLLRVGLEPFVPRRRDAGEESVWSFARRRLGRQAADRLVAPMVLGIFAGDAKRLSIAAAFPRLAALEDEHGSLVRGMIARRREAKDAAGGPAGPAGSLVSFRDGLQALPNALARGRFTVRRGARVEGIERVDGSYRLRVGSEVVSADAVVLACEAWAAAPLARDLAPRLGDLLAGIRYPPVTVVALGFGPEARDRVPHGFGVLIPRGEGLRTLGVLWDSHVFPGRSPGRSLLVRAMLGGALDPQAALGDEAELVSLVRRELAQLSGLRDEPVYSHVARWERAIPQYELSHTARVREVEQVLQRVPGLFVAGNALRGVAFGKAAAAGIAAGEAALRHLRMPHAAP